MKYRNIFWAVLLGLLVFLSTHSAQAELISECASETDRDLLSQCQTEAAISTQDVSKCTYDLVNTNSNKYSLIIDNPSCLLDYHVEHTNSSYCDDLDWYEKNICYKHFALVLEQPDLCSNLMSPSIGHCLANYAIEKNDGEICLIASEQEDLDQCFSVIAGIFKDPKYCDSIKSYSMRENCHVDLGFILTSTGSLKVWFIIFAKQVLLAFFVILLFYCLYKLKALFDKIPSEWIKVPIRIISFILLVYCGSILFLISLESVFSIPEEAFYYLQFYILVGLVVYNWLVHKRYSPVYLFALIIAPIQLFVNYSTTSYDNVSSFIMYQFLWLFMCMYLYRFHHRRVIDITIKILFFLPSMIVLTFLFWY